jgi:nucleoside-diphosphate-sugar epimerase
MARRILISGGAGFVGSHLCERLVGRGDEVVCVDNLSTGRASNLAALTTDPRFSLLRADVCEPLTELGDSRFTAVVHLASPASPPAYLERPLETLDVGSIGTRQLLGIAHRDSARFVLASTSEVYGDPLVHPQTEEYWGNVNPIGERSVYDEAKRFAEALTMGHHRALATEVGIVRIFNTYGPRLQPDDGRAVSNFISQALRDEPLTIYGDGSQTRSFCYVDDLVEGLVRMIDATVTGPINLGNPTEYTLSELAHEVQLAVGVDSGTVHRALPSDDPKLRRPDISRAGELLGWAPQVQLREGLARTVAWLRQQLSADTDRHLH